MFRTDRYTQQRRQRKLVPARYRSSHTLHTRARAPLDTRPRPREMFYLLSFSNRFYWYKSTKESVVINTVCHLICASVNHQDIVNHIRSFHFIIVQHFLIRYNIDVIIFQKCCRWQLQVQPIWRDIISELFEPRLNAKCGLPASRCIGGNFEVNESMHKRVQSLK